MTWIIFDDEDRRTPAPPFKLKAIDGSEVESSDYRQNCCLVLYFLKGLSCESCLQAVREFSDRRMEYLQLDAEVLAVLPEPLERLVDKPELQGLEIRVASDPGSLVRARYAGLMAEGLIPPDDDLVVVLDQYGAPYTALIGAIADEPDYHRDIQSWLQFIGVQCPE